MILIYIRIYFKMLCNYYSYDDDICKDIFLDVIE